MKLLIVHITENDKMAYKKEHFTSGIKTEYSNMEFMPEEEVKRVYKNKQFFCLSQLNDNYIGVSLDTWGSRQDLTISIHEYVTIPERYLDNVLVLFIDNSKSKKDTKNLAMSVIEELELAENSHRMWLWCDQNDDIAKIKQDVKTIIFSSDPHRTYELYKTQHFDI